MKRLLLTFAAAGALALGAVACSSDEGNTAAPTTAGPTSSTTALPRPASAETAEGLTEAATRYLSSGVEGKYAESFSEMSDRCRKEWGTADKWKANMEYATAVLVNMGFSADGAKVESVEPGPIEAGKADVTAVVKTADDKVITPLAESTWVYEDGGWRIDSCTSAMP